MKRIISSVVLIFMLCVSEGYAQNSYSLKVETGYLNFRRTLIDVDPGPNWKGYYLRGDDGIDVNVINGISFNKKVFVGVGIGYLNFKGVEGLAVFSDFEYLPLKSRLTPLINLRFGYSHLWNQYENGTGDGTGELGLGFNYKITDKVHIYAKSGFLISQQALLYPLRIGIRL